MGSDVCPKCGSDDVIVGNYVLSCCACRWHYLNDHPCTVCGKPSVGVVGAGGPVFYGCRDHPAGEHAAALLLRTLGELKP